MDWITQVKSFRKLSRTSKLKELSFLEMTMLLTMLDEDSLEQIFLYLSEVDLVNLSMVNSYCRELVNEFLKISIAKKLMVCEKKR